MANPFPGVDPYIEDAALWNDFHLMMLAATARVVRKLLPPGYDARVEEQVSYDIYFADEPPDEPPAGGPVRTVTPVQRRQPDVAVEVADLRVADATTAAPAVATAAPPTSTVQYRVADESRERHIRVTRDAGRRLVTVLEVLSPTNKGTGFAAYQDKREQMIRKGVHLVELDLLRIGRRGRELGGSDADYVALVTRGDWAPGALTTTSLWAWRVRDALPDVPLPLAKEHGEVTLPLGRAYDLAHEDGDYHLALRRDHPAPRGLAGDDAAWAAALHAGRWG